MTQDPNNPYGGLLGDSFFNPQRMGLLGISQGLLQAGGPSATPVGFGDALGKGFSGGIQGMQQGAQLQKQDVMTRLQMEKLLREKRQQEALAKLYAGQGGNPMVPGPSSSVMAGSGETPAMGSAPSASRGPNLDQLGALAATGLKVDDHLKLWELRNPKVNFQNGIPVDERTGLPRTNVPTLPQTNQLGFSTRPTIGADGNITIGVTPGSADAFRLQQDITEGAKAAYDLVSVPTVGGGTQLMPRSVAAQRLGGGSTAPSTAPQAPAGHMAPPVAPKTVPGAGGGAIGYQKPEAVRAAERVLSEGRAKDSLDRSQKFRAAWTASSDRMSQLNLVESLMSDPNVASGALADQVSSVKGLADSFGIKTEGKRAEDVISAVAGEMALKMRNQGGENLMPGQMSNFEQKLLQNMSPSLSQSREGRVMLTQVFKAKAQRDMQLAELAAEYEDKHGVLDSGFEKQARAFVKANPMFEQSQIDNMVKKAQVLSKARTNKPAVKISPATQKLLDEFAPEQ